MEINYLKEAEELIVMFKRYKKPIVAEQISNILKGACTGTELIMGLNSFLSGLESNDVPDLLKPKINKLVDAIDVFLQS